MLYRVMCFHVEVETVSYHWRVPMYCRKDADNFQAEVACVEPKKKKKKRRQRKERTSDDGDSRKLQLSLFLCAKVHPSICKHLCQQTLSKQTQSFLNRRI